jgi:hypothetical protein
MISRKTILIKIEISDKTFSWKLVTESELQQVSLVNTDETGYQVYSVTSVERMAFGDPDDKDTEQGLLHERDLGSGLEEKASLVLRRPAVRAVVLLAAGDEEEFVKSGQVRDGRVGLVPLQGIVAEPGQGVLLN